MFLLLHCPRWLFLAPAVLLFSLGIALMVAILPGPLVVGSIALDVHTLVVASAMMDVGLQTMMFWFLAKQYAVTQGLLPQTPLSRKLLSATTLERTLIVGLAAVAFGAAVLLRTTLHWGAANFAALDYETTLRQVVPSTTLIILGLQTIFFGFLSSLMKLTALPADAPAQELIGAHGKDPLR